MRTTAPLLLAATLTLSACSDDAAPATSRATTATRTPQVTLVDADQLAAKIAAAKGRGLLVNLWAMW